MSLTLEESRLHKAYANLENLTRHPADLPARIKLATDEGFDALAAVMSDNAIQYCKDDRAEAWSRASSNSSANRTGLIRPISRRLKPSDFL